MLFRPLEIPGVFAIEAERQTDTRGFFAKTWSAEQFRAQGLNPALAEASVSHNPKAGTLRGLHFQTEPHEEAKLVRCTQGAIFDVAVDLRPSSPTFKRYAALELTAENRLALYVPEGCAHGFLTLTEHCEVLYLISQTYAPEHSAGVRWDDPAFAIAWPHPPTLMSTRDRNYPDFVE
jgi:dTDP-4-dehydrorhamnose 3,5-epimerase